jgi:hypothetical protein
MCPNTHGEAVNLQRQFDPRRLPVILDHAHGDGRCGALDASAFVFDAGRRALGSKECPHIVPEPWRANPVRVAADSDTLDRAVFLARSRGAGHQRR